MPQDSKHSAAAHYQLALKASARGDVPDAVLHARSALRLNPQDPEYRLLLAKALGEAGDREEAVRLLAELQEEGPRADVLYLLGVNLLELQDPGQARECFDACLELEPDGEQARQIRRLKWRLQPERHSPFSRLGRAGEQEAHRRAAQIDRCLADGQFERSLQLAEQASASYADVPAVRNSLAMACFCNGQIERAVQITRSVLEQSPDDLDASCNMASFQRQLGQDEQAEASLKKLEQMQPPDVRGALKISATFCEQRQYDRAYRTMKEFHSRQAGGAATLFRQAAAAQNSGRAQEALRLLSDISKIEEAPLAADYFRRQIQEMEEGRSPRIEIPYHYRLPAEEASRRRAYLNSCLRLDHGALLTLWKHDDDFQRTVQWAMEQADDGTRLKTGALLASFADARSEELLRKSLVRRAVPDRTKREILSRLAGMGAVSPYVAFLHGELVRFEAEPSLPDALLAAVRQGAALLGCPEFEQPAVELLLAASPLESPDQPAALAAAALWLAGRAAGQDLDLDGAAEKTGADPDAARAGLALLEQSAAAKQAISES